MVEVGCAARTWVMFGAVYRANGIVNLAYVAVVSYAEIDAAIDLGTISTALTANPGVGIVVAGGTLGGDDALNRATDFAAGVQDARVGIQTGCAGR